MLRGSHSVKILVVLVAKEYPDCIIVMVGADKEDSRVPHAGEDGIPHGESCPTVQLLVDLLPIVAEQPLWLRLRVPARSHIVGHQTREVGDSLAWVARADVVAVLDRVQVAVVLASVSLPISVRVSLVWIRHQPEVKRQFSDSIDQ